MKYTQRQWDREIGWGKVPEEYKLKEKPMHPYFKKQLGLEDEDTPDYIGPEPLPDFDEEGKEIKPKNKLEEYRDKINYDIWEDVTRVQGITFGHQPYNIKEVNVTFNMKDNEYVQSRTDKPTRSNDRNNKS